MTQAIVALKGPAGAKSRLAPCLTAAQREALYFTMARRVLRALSAVPRIRAVWVVTASDEVARFVQRVCPGCRLIREPDEAGTCQAFERGRLALPADTSRLFIAGDLPLITLASVDELLDVAHHGAVLVPDRRQLGTNALLLPKNSQLPLAFGQGSLAAHRKAAGELNLPLLVSDIEALTLDIDEPEDLDELKRRTGSAGLSSLIEPEPAHVAA